MRVRTLEGAVVLDIFVQPRASKPRFGPVHDDRIKVFVTSPPVDGEANKAVIVLMSKLFGVAKRDVQITQGQQSRRKTLRISGVTEAQIQEALR